MLKKYLFVVAISVFIAGCGAKKPTQLDNGSALHPNTSVLEQRYNFIPKDPYLSSFNWTYTIIAEKNGEYLLKNEQVMKTFLLAHNATKIIIVGRKDLIKEYEKYFKDNQVDAFIELQDITPIERDYNKVNLLFFNQTNPQKPTKRRKG